VYTKSFPGSTLAKKASSFSAPLIATLKERIIGWQYPPEYRLTEDGLCREFGVSRSPVREALRVLATTGFVRRTDSGGYVVRQVSVKEVEEMYEVRMALELYTVEALATRGAPPDGLAALAKTWKEISRQPKRTVEDLAALDAHFHEGLAKLLGNQTLVRQIEAINERLYLFRTIDFATAKRVQGTCTQHLAILDRIAARDAAGAREALRQNIEDGRNIVGNSIKEALARAYASA
jgi:DNA-binding GntR family transcriptional regulator